MIGYIEIQAPTVETLARSETANNQTETPTNPYFRTTTRTLVTMGTDQGRSLVVLPAIT
ncbi:MAG: hypothetical protein MJK13_07345 [Pseudomonadales bacterium]|nr:hypothetical protein [Pseudomonadales bacterium]